MKIVVFSFFPAFRPPKSGGEERLFNYYNELSNHCSISLISSGDPGETIIEINHNPSFREIRVPKGANFSKCWEELLPHSGRGDLSGPAIGLAGQYPDAMHKVALEETENADLIIHDFPFTISYDLLAGIDGIPRIYNSHNCEFDLYKNLHGDSTSNKIMELVFELENKMCQLADKIICCSSNDKSSFSQIYDLDENKIIYLPNGMTIREPLSKNQEKQKEFNTVFIGSSHLPNIEAADYIVEKIAPQCPNVTFNIIGSCLKDKPLPRNVIRHGFLEETKKDEVLNNASIALNPMLSGSGSNIKILDYISREIPVISTEVGLRGFKFENKKHVFISELKDFSELIKVNFENQLECKKIARSALDFSKSIYSWQVISESFYSIISEIINNQSKSKFILALNDFDPFLGNGGGCVRIRGLYSAYCSEWKVVSICFSSGEKVHVESVSNNLKVIKIPKTLTHLKEERVYAEMHHVSANDIVAINQCTKNELLLLTYKNLRKSSQIVIIDHPYMVKLPMEFNDRFIYSSHNAETQIKENLLANHPHKKILLDSVELAESYAVGASAAIFCVSEDDAIKLGTNRTLVSSIVVVPNGAADPHQLISDNEANSTNDAPQNEVVFIGSSHIPNVESAKWICNELAPLLPMIKFNIVGSVCESLGEKLPSNIILSGNVTDEEKANIFRKSSLAINPMFNGGGSNIKTADYLVNGLHIVSTPFGIRGYEESVYQDVSVCDDLNDFVVTIMELLKSKAGSITEKKIRQNRWVSSLAMNSRAKISIAHIKSLLKLKSKVLFVTYRYTYPILGGGEAHLYELITRLAKTDDFDIDVVSPAVTSIKDIFRFGSNYNFEKNSSTPYGTLGIRSIRLPLSETSTSTESLTKIWLNQIKFEKILFEKKGCEKTQLAWGWSDLEGEINSSNRWSYLSCGIFIEEDAVIEINGFSPKERTLLINGKEGLLLHKRIEGEFNLNIFANAGVIDLSWAGERLTKEDPRPLGALIRSVKINGTEIINEEYSLLKNNGQFKPSEYFELLDKVSEESRVESFLTKSRGPRSNSLEKFLDVAIKHYDVVVTHNTVFRTATKAVEYAKESGVPIIVIPHAHLDDDYYHFQDVKEASIDADVLLASPRESLNYFKKISKGIVEYLPPGCKNNFQLYKSMDSSFKKLYPYNNPYFLILGRKSPSKGYEYIIESTKSLCEKNDIKILMIGYDEDLKPIKYDHVIYIGNQPDEIVNEALSKSLALINFSESESFGMVIIESWMSSRPVIVNENCAAFSELVAHGKNGYLVNKNNLKDYVKLMFENKDLCDRMGKNGREKAMDFTWDNIGERFIEIVRNTCGSN